MSDSQTCINCGQETDTPYCPNCGQHQTVKPISLKEIILEFTSKWIGWDNKFMRTIKDLTIRPGVVSREFIKGNRVKYIGPLGYLFLVSTIMILSFQILDIDVQAYMEDTSKGIVPEQGTDISEKQAQFTSDLMKLMSDYFRFVSAGLIPFVALVAFMFYRKKGYNYLEHLVNMLFLGGHAYWLTVLHIIFYKFSSVNISSINLIINLGYLCFGFISFYEIKNKFLGSLKALIIWCLGYILFIVAFMIISIIYLVLFSDLI